MRMITTNSDTKGTDQNQNSALDTDDSHLSQTFHDGTRRASTGYNSSDSKAEKEERSLALEKTYVYDVYEQIAPHFKESRRRPWPRIRQFLMELEPGSLVCDVGCGNGKYLDINSEVFKVGSDRCYKLVKIAREDGQHQVLACDNMALPFRDESFDAALSTAVIHHFATTERRVHALRELARILRIGGRLMITVWALEQRHRKFESQDVLVPWHKPVQSSSEDQTSIDKDITSTTTSDDDILNYHAYTSGMESEPYFVPACYPRKKHKFRDGWVHYRGSGKNLDSCRSSSQSSSDLSSPNETCYSFVRRALQKLSSSNKTRNDPHQRCRPPWFLQSMESGMAGGGEGGFGSGSGEKPDSLESNENADDIPIELHDLDSEVYDGGFRSPSELRKKSSSSSSSKDAGKSPASKALKRSSSVDVDDSSSAAMSQHKSKSLSDILSLFTINFLYSRKASQDSTSGSSCSSLAKQQPSSTSQGDTNTSTATTPSSKQLPNRPPRNGQVVRSKSSHFTLAKVDEGNEQVASLQQPSPSAVPPPVEDDLPNPAPTPPTLPAQRWSIAGYSGTTLHDRSTNSGETISDGDRKESSSSATRRPRSLVLGRETVHFPLTLSAEDHKNGNTILPDLDGCLSFYGLATSKRSGSDDNELSPPYTKAKSNASPPDCPSNRLAEARATIEHQNNKRNASNSERSHRTVGYSSSSHEKTSTSGHTSETKITACHTEQCVKIGRCCAKASSEPAHAQLLRGGLSQSGESPTALKEARLRWKTAESFNVARKRPSMDTWKDLHSANLIDQLIHREHLFPCHSMPNLYGEVDEKLITGSDCSRLADKILSMQRRFSQPTTRHLRKSDDASTAPFTWAFPFPPPKNLEESGGGAVLSDCFPRNGLQKRSFSVGKIRECCWRGGGAGGLDMEGRRLSMGLPCHKNRCVLRRQRSSSAFHCPPSDEWRLLQSNILRHSYSTGDTLLSLATKDCSPLSPSFQHTIKVGSNKIIMKEDSLQSDTSVDSDDSVASVIVVQRERTPSVEGTPGELVASAVTSPSRDGRVLPMVRPERQASVCSKEGSNHSDTSVDSEDSCVSVIVMPQKGSREEEEEEEASAAETAAGNPENEENSVEEECRLNEMCDFFVEEDNRAPEERLVMKASVSWEKYLDACESLVLDSIFDVNAAHSDYAEEHISIAHVLPNVVESVSLEYFDCARPLTAEMCWLDPATTSSATCSWMSTSSTDDDRSDVENLPSLSEDVAHSASPSCLDDELRLDFDLPDVSITSSSAGSDGAADPRSSSACSLSSYPAAFPPDSPQGRLLEAAVDVANSLQSAVSVAVTSSRTVGESSPIVEPSGLDDSHACDPSNTAERNNTTDCISCDDEAFSGSGSSTLQPEDKTDEFHADSCSSFEPPKTTDFTCAGISPESSRNNQVPTSASTLTLSDGRTNSPSTEDLAAITATEEYPECFGETPIEFPVVNPPHNIRALPYEPPANQQSDSDLVPGETLQEEHHRRVRAAEDVINGNVPGHRELLKKMVRESSGGTGFSWLNLKGFDELLRNAQLANELAEAKERESLARNRRRKSDSEAEWSSASSTAPSAAASKSMSRGKSLDSFSSTRRKNMKESHCCDACTTAAAANGERRIPPDGVLPDRITEEDETMTRSNESAKSCGAEAADGSTTDTAIHRSVKATTTDLMQTSVASSIENHLGNLEFLATDGERNELSKSAVQRIAQMSSEIQRHEASASPTEEPGFGSESSRQEGKVQGCGPQRDSLSLSTSEDSILSGSENGGSATYHRYYHVFREGELDHLIDKYVENLHIISSYYDHANWCIVAEKVQVWRI